MGSKIELGELSVGDFYALGIFVFVQFRSHFETFLWTRSSKSVANMTQLFMDTP